MSKLRKVLFQISFVAKIEDEDLVEAAKEIEQEYKTDTVWEDVSVKLTELEQ